MFNRNVLYLSSKKLNPIFMKFIISIVFALIAFTSFSQVPTSDWILDDGFSESKFTEENLRSNYGQIVTLLTNVLSNGNANSFVSKSVYEDIIEQHIDTSNHEQIESSYLWLENKYPNVKAKYADNITTISAEIQSIDKVYFRFEDNGNLLTGRASVLITTTKNESFVVLFKNLCKVNNQWYIVNDVKLKPFNQ